MDNKNKSAFPTMEANEHVGLTGKEDGLTKREYFAAKVLQGLCAGRTEYEQPGADAKYAVKLADALLEALAKKEA